MKAAAPAKERKVAVRKALASSGVMERALASPNPLCP